MQIKALVIDDSRSMRRIVMKGLRHANLAEFEFTEATDGADALAKFDPEQFDMCFVDWNMPNISSAQDWDNGPEGSERRTTMEDN